MATLVKISINDDIAAALSRVKKEYPTLDTPELFKLALAELDRKVWRERRKRWEDSLPIMELTEEQQIELQKAIDEADKKRAAGGMEAMNLADFKAYLKRAVAESVD